MELLRVTPTGLLGRDGTSEGIILPIGAACFLYFSNVVRFGNFLVLARCLSVPKLEIWSISGFNALYMSHSVHMCI